MKRLSIRLVCLTITLLTTGRVAADGLMRDGLGAISGGRGGTNIAFADTGVILLDNPAGMVNIRGRGLTEFSVDTVFTELRYTDAHNSGVYAEQTPFPLPYASLIHKSDDGIWAFGCGMFAPAGFGAKYDIYPPGSTDPYRHRSFGAFGKMITGVSCRVTEDLAIGGTMGAAINHTELDLPGMELRANGLAFIWSLGLQYELTERTTLGLAYNSAADFDLNGTAAMDFGGGVHGRYDMDMGIKWPESLGGGIRHQLNRRQTVAADVIWYNWSDAFDSVSMTMSNPNNPVLLPIAPTIAQQLPLNWRDTVSMRLGFEQELTTSSVLRTGYIYHRNPVPSSTLSPMIPGILEHGFSTGYGYRWQDRRIDLAYQYSFGRTRDTEAGNPLGFDNGRVDAAAHWLFLTFQQQF
jgi:long-chain fatty acid transport protein